LNELNKTDITEYIKYYPPQNKILSKILAENININSDYILMGNGAIQLIELIMREFEGKKKCIVSPTFSSYYDYDFHNILFFKTYKEENFKINVDELINY